MNKLLNVWCITLLVGLGGSVQAMSLSENDQEQLSAFTDVITVQPVGVAVPTVVALSLEDKLDSNSSWQDVVVREVETGKLLGIHIEDKFSDLPLLGVEATPANNNKQLMVDKKYDTYAEFSATAEDLNEVTIELIYSDLITTDTLYLALPPNVALPVGIKIEAGQQNSTKELLVNTKKLYDTRINFPEVSADYLVVTLYHYQPLRIAELEFLPVDLNENDERFATWLAQPEYTYEVYINADRPVRINTTEAGRYRVGDAAAVVSSALTKTNPLYIPGDQDDDGVLDKRDNCILVANPEQTDVDRNGKGDACEDFDKDGVMNDKDNCPADPNRYQTDEDNDGIGDVCDESESRFTERNPWVPWIGIGTAFVVVLGLFVLVARAPRREEM